MVKKTQPNLETLLFACQTGIDPVPERKRTTTWKTFFKAHWESIAAVDFTTVEV